LCVDKNNIRNKTAVQGRCNFDIINTSIKGLILIYNSYILNKKDWHHRGVALFIRQLFFNLICLRGVYYEQLYGKLGLNQKYSD